jgi:hypothetical protein
VAVDLKKLLDEIGKSNELTLFFKNLWKENSTQAKLFFLHREQLFPYEEKVFIPYIFWSNIQEEMEGRSILDIVTELGEIKMQQSWDTLGFEKLLNGIKDLIAYFALKVIRENDGIKELVLDKELSFRKMKVVLGDYKKINFDVLKQEEIESIPELNSIVKASFMRFVKTFDPAKLIETLSSTSEIASTLPLMAIPHLNRLLETIDFDLDEYADLINELYVLKLITNFQTLFWCEHCLDTPQILLTTSRIDPNHMQMKCLKCRQPMLACSIYNINGLLQNCVLFKDGLLAVALGWLLDQRKIKWAFSIHNEYENDFVCETRNEEKILFECKMHLIPKDERSLRGQLQQDLVMLLAHIRALSKENTRPKKVYLVYNYDLKNYSEEVNKTLADPKLKSDILRYSVKPIGFPEIVPVLTEEYEQPE